MALSRPQLIQFPIQCQLCNKDPKISCKCFECDLLMCSECEHNIHPKIKTAGEHRIIAINDIVSTSSPNTVIGSTSPSSRDSANVDMTVVEEYQTKLGGVFHLTISLDDSLWIGDGYYKKKIRFLSSHTGLQKVKCERNRLQLISSFNNQIYNLAINPGNDLLLATDGPILKQIKSGKHKVVDTVYDLYSYQPISIYVTRNNKVVVGAWNRHEHHVIVMDNEGNHEKVYGEDQTKCISFTCPWRITGTNNDNIFVIDRTGDEYEGRVVLLGQEDIINTYSGHSVINTENRPFTPSDITTTPTDNVIVVDSDSSTLHVLNSSGQMMIYISLKDKGILQDPFSIGLAMTGHFCMLYIGTVTEEGSKDKAKLYKLTLKGC